jgi:uncharacterized protein
MFRRRYPLSPLQRIKIFIIPPNGWSRSIRYIGHRTLRLPGTPSTIAKGFAWGVAASFTPLLGFHLGIAFLGAWLTRANMFAAALGTFMGNPLTFIPIFTLLYQTGKFILQREGEDTPLKVIFNDIDNPLNFMESIPILYDPVLKPMLIGALLIAPLVWLITYYPCRHLVHKYQKKRKRMIRH